MPPLTRWFVKAGFIYLLAALLTGVALMARPLWDSPPVMGALNPVYFHLFLLGWVTQLIFGVVYWMFPKYSQQNPHGNERLWLAVFGLLNVGLVLRVLGEPLRATSPSPMWGWLLALSAVLQWLAGMGFVLNTWGRVKGR
jgi:cbb3-type cytochrome oxidase subunit 1